MAKKKTEQAAGNAFGLHGAAYQMECTQAAQTARKLGKGKAMVTEGSFQFKAKIHAEDLLGTKFFNDVFVVVHEETGKQLTIEGGEVPVGGVYEPRATDFAPYSHVKDSDHNLHVEYDDAGTDGAARTAEDIECRTIKLKKVIAEGEYATLIFQAVGCNPHAVGWREWMGQKHSVKFVLKDEAQKHKEAMAEQKVKVTQGQGGLLAVEPE